MITWKKCGLSWCSFKHKNLNEIEGVGAYIIWRIASRDPSGMPILPRAVYVGSGNIPERIEEHREDARIKAYVNGDNLRFTWAYLLAGDRRGVERFLAERLDPLVGERYPAVPPIPVNLPQWY